MHPSIALHKKHRGKIEVNSKIAIQTKEDLALVYTPGVAEVCREIMRDPKSVYELTIKGNTVAVITDGSAVLGLGNIGPEAALPVMEGKAMLFKQYAGIDAFPLCLKTQNTQEIIEIIRNITPVFGGINLEDIAAPRCFEIEEALQDIGIPVFHDDQHGTAIVLLAALKNAARLAGKALTDLKIVINGGGAAGAAIAQLLLCVGHDDRVCQPVKDIFVCDSKGIISRDRDDIRSNPMKVKLANITNREQRIGGLEDAIMGTDVFIGVSVGGALKSSLIPTMNEKPIIFAMANPTPEIMPDEAMKAGAFIVGTGRSDFPNQVNNVLAFPGIFRGALDARAPRITNTMKLAAAYALADYIKNPTVDNIMPSALDAGATQVVAEAVKKAWEEEK